MVAVYYEALCPDSKNFIIKQLQFAFTHAPTLIDFQLIPYGKADVSILKARILKIYFTNSQSLCRRQSIQMARWSSHVNMEN